jgi:hypothetical protein
MSRARFENMHRHETRIGLIRNVGRRHPLKSQRDLVERHGATRIVELDGKDAYDAKTLSRGWRDGHVLVIPWLSFIAPRNRSPQVKRDTVLLFIDNVLSSGAVILEAHTGRRTDNPDEAVAMRSVALEMVTRDRPPALRPPGRPSKKPEDDAKAKSIWDNLREYPTYTKCEDAFPKHWGTWQKAFRLWGARGRLARKKRKT